MNKLNSMYYVADTIGFELMLLSVIQFRVCYYDFYWKFICHSKVLLSYYFRKYFWLPCKSIRVVSYLTGEGCLIDAINTKIITYNYNTTLSLDKVYCEWQKDYFGNNRNIFVSRPFFCVCVCYVAAPQSILGHYWEDSLTFLLLIIVCSYGMII